MASSRFSFTSTDISELDIEWLLENNIALSQVLPQAQYDTYSPPHSPVDGAFDDLPALSPSSATPSSLPYFNSSSPIPESPDTPLASRQRQTTLSRSPRTESLTSYSFPPPQSSSPSHSRSSTPTPTTPLTSPSSLQQSFPIPKLTHSRVSTRSSTIMVELDDFFPHKPSNTFTPFPAFSSSASSSTSNLSIDPPPSGQERKGSLASSFFSTNSTSSSSSSNYSSDSSSTRTRTRTRTRSISGKSIKSTTSGGGGGGMEFGGKGMELGGELRQPKLAAYPRYVPPKPTKQEGAEGSVRSRIRMFGGR